MLPPPPHILSIDYCHKKRKIAVTSIKRIQRFALLLTATNHAVFYSVYTISTTAYFTSLRSSRLLHWRFSLRSAGFLSHLLPFSCTPAEEYMSQNLTFSPLQLFVPAYWPRGPPRLIPLLQAGIIIIHFFESLSLICKYCADIQEYLYAR